MGRTGSERVECFGLWTRHFPRISGGGLSVLFIIHSCPCAFMAFGWRLGKGGTGSRADGDTIEYLGHGWFHNVCSRRRAL